MHRSLHHLHLRQHRHSRRLHSRPQLPPLRRCYRRPCPLRLHQAQLRPCSTQAHGAGRNAMLRLGPARTCAVSAAHVAVNGMTSTSRSAALVPVAARTSIAAPTSSCSLRRSGRRLRSPPLCLHRRRCPHRVRQALPLPRSPPSPPQSSPHHSTSLQERASCG